MSIASIFEDNDINTAGQKLNASTAIFSAQCAAKNCPEAGRDFLMQFCGMDEDQAWAILDGEASLMGDSEGGFFYLQAPK